MRKLVVLCLAILFIFTTTVSSTASSAKAKENIRTIELEESIKMVENVLDQAQIAEESIFELDKKTKQKLIVQLDKILRKSSKYNVDLTSKFQASDFEVNAQKLMDGTVQYSLSRTDISTNEKNIINKYELLNFVFDEKLKLKNKFEIKGELTDQNIVNSKIWIDGKVNNEIVVDATNLLNDSNTEKTGDAIVEEKINDISIKESKEFTGSSLASRWSCTQSCVASKGVNLMIIGVMVGICGAVCNPAALAASAGLAGGACYACVNTTGIAGLSTVMNCWNKCPK